MHIRNVRNLLYNALKESLSSSQTRRWSLGCYNTIPVGPVDLEVWQIGCPDDTVTSMSSPVSRYVGKNYDAPECEGILGSSSHNTICLGRRALCNRKKMLIDPRHSGLRNTCKRSSTNLLEGGEMLRTKRDAHISILVSVIIVVYRVPLTRTLVEEASTNRTETRYCLP